MPVIANSPPELGFRSTLNKAQRARIADFLNARATGEPQHTILEFPLPDGAGFDTYEHDWMISPYMSDFIEQLGFLIYILTTRGVIIGYSYHNGVWHVECYDGIEIKSSRIAFDALGEAVLHYLNTTAKKEG